MNAIASVRRGGTLSISGVYGGAMDPLPMMDMFDKQIQIRMGQANVRRWVDDILPLLMRRGPARLGGLRHAPAAARRGGRRRTRCSRRRRTARSRWCSSRRSTGPVLGRIAEPERRRRLLASRIARAARRSARSRAPADAAPARPALVGAAAPGRARPRLRARVHGALDHDPGPDPARRSTRRSSAARRPALPLPRRDPRARARCASASTSRAASPRRGSASRSRRACAGCSTTPISPTRARSTTGTRPAR